MHLPKTKLMECVASRQERVQEDPIALHTVIAESSGLSIRKDHGPMRALILGQQGDVKRLPCLLGVGAVVKDRDVERYDVQ